MTIDEAIIHAREVASEQKRRSGICVQNNSECDKFSACLKCSEEHEQLAEWLEELKVYQQHEIICRKGYNAGYNKAIDDFIEKVELKYLGVHPDELYEKYYPREICKQIKEIAEQLKAGGKNESK